MLLVVGDLDARRGVHARSVPPIDATASLIGIEKLRHSHQPIMAIEWFPGYWEEYKADPSGNGSKLQQAIEDSNDLAYKTVREHWSTVSALAQRLLEGGELRREEAFDFIRSHLDESWGNAE